MGSNKLDEVKKLDIVCKIGIAAGFVCIYLSMNFGTGDFALILAPIVMIFCVIYFIIISGYIEGVKEKSVRYNDNILKLLALVMNANGKQMVCELEQVKDTIRRYFETPKDQKKALSTFREYLGSFNNMGINSLAELLKNDPNFDSESVIMEAMAVAFADGEFSEPEVALLQRLSSKLGMNYSQYISTLAIFKRRKAKGDFGDTKVNNDDTPLQTREKFKEYSTHDFNQYGMGYWQRDKNGKKTWVQTDYRFSNRSRGSESNSNRQSDNQSNRQSDTRTYTPSATEIDYQTLGINSSATDDEVRTAWKQMIRKWHPDRFSASGDEAVRSATENSKIINQAYENICKARNMK